MSDSRISVDTAWFAPASEWMLEVGDGINALESTLANQNWYPADSWRTAAAFKVLQASGEAPLVTLGVAGLAEMAHDLASHLLQAQRWYEDVDAQVVAAFAELSDAVTTAMVTSIVNLGMLSAGALVGAMMSPGGVALLVAGAVTYRELERAGVVMTGEELTEWLGTNQHALANPVMVMLARAIVSGGDEILGGPVAGAAGAAAGAVLGPLGAVAAHVLIRQGLSTPQAAAGTIANAVQRARGQHRYEVASTERRPAETPESIGDLMASIPDTDPDGAHVTVSEYRQPDGQTVYLVSIAGTSSSEFGGDNPMDNLSNLAAYAGDDDETIGAAITAMEHAGVTSGDRVVFAGYSQGALVASALAASGEWATQSVVLAGSPVHGNEIGADIPVVQLEHSGDLITGLQGFVAPAAGEVAVIHRDPYPDGVPASHGILGPHMLTTYRETAALYDADSATASAANRAAVLGPLTNATPVATADFHLRREYGDSAATSSTMRP